LIFVPFARIRINFTRKFDNHCSYKAYQCGAFGHFPVLDQKIEILKKNVAMTKFCIAPSNEDVQQSALVCVESSGCAL
jgi:hypothetical protein